VTESNGTVITGRRKMEIVDDLARLMVVTAYL
jgi:hypothetical protein